MANEIIYVCHSINNKNVRDGELNILEKFPEKLYFQFGENNMNIKKRFYNDLETLNKDFENLLKLKNNKNIVIDSEEIDEELTMNKKNSAKKIASCFKNKSNLMIFLH